MFGHDHHPLVRQFVPGLQLFGVLDEVGRVLWDVEVLRGGRWIGEMLRDI